MLWSPSEVLAYLKDDLGIPGNKDGPMKSKLLPTEVFGGFQTWPSPKEDFILIAENSEIHGPNPLFTIPELDSSIDLNGLTTKLLGSDYQALSNYKVLPGKNVQLLMPDIESDIHVAITYFFLFDSEARGFVRPTSLAYVTSDKHKLLMLAQSILETLGKAAEILQHTNIKHHVDDLKALKEAEQKSMSESQGTNGFFAESHLQDIQQILETNEKYEGNKLYDTLLENIMNYLQQNISEKLKNLDSTYTSVPKVVSKKRSQRTKALKNLHHLCHNGLVLGLYHLYIMHKHFKRKYENVIVAKHFSSKQGCILHFGACIKSSQSPIYQKKCVLHSFKVPCTLSLKSELYFECLDETFENLLERLIKSVKETQEQQQSSIKASSESTNSSELTGCSSIDSASGTKEESDKLCCGHVTSIGNLWDVIEFLKSENPGIEESFLSVLKLFGDTQRLLFSVLTRTPIIVISTPKQLHTAESFLKALSVFMPRRKDEEIFVDTNRQDAMKRSYYSNFGAINVCVHDDTIENVLPLEHLPSMCVLNLKDLSFTAPMYTGHLLSKVEDRIKALPPSGPVFPEFVNVLTEVQRTIEWWHMITSSTVDFSQASEYVLSKGYNRLDIQIIEALYKLCRD